MELEKGPQWQEMEIYFPPEVNMNSGSKSWESSAAYAAIGLAQSGDTSLRSFCATVHAVMPSILGP